MPLYGKEVNPASILQGETIAKRTKTVKDKRTGEEKIIVLETTKAKTVGFCESGNGFIHINGGCYDTRFSTVVRPLD